LFTFYLQYMSSFKRRLTCQPFCSPSIHTWHSCAARMLTSASLHTQACTGRRLSAEWRPRGRRRCLYVLILINRLIHIRGARALTLSLYIHQSSTDIGHSNSLLGYSDLVLLDSGWFRNPVIPYSGGSEYGKIRRIRMLPDSELTAESGFWTRIWRTSQFYFTCFIIFCIFLVKF